MGRVDRLELSVRELAAAIAEVGGKRELTDRMIAVAERHKGEPDPEPDPIDPPLSVREAMKDLRERQRKT